MNRYLSACRISAGLVMAGVLPLAVHAQSAVNAALGAPAQSKVAAPTPTPTVQPGAGGAISARPAVKDASYAIARSCGFSADAPPPADPAVCAAYREWIDRADDDLNARNRSARFTILDGQVLQISWDIPQGVQLHPVLPVILPAYPDERPELNGATLFHLSYAVENGLPVIYAETEAYPQTQATRTRYEVTPGRPLQITMGFGDTVTVVPTLRPPRPDEIVVAARPVPTKE